MIEYALNARLTLAVVFIGCKGVLVALLSGLCSIIVSGFVRSKIMRFFGNLNYINVIITLVLNGYGNTQGFVVLDKNYFRFQTENVS